MPQRLQDITAPNSDHFQHVGQQSFMTTAHSHQPDATGRAPSVDGAETVTGSAQIGAVRQAAWGDDDPACAHGRDDCRDAHAGARLPGDRVLATGSRCADD